MYKKILLLIAVFIISGATATELSAELINDNADVVSLYARGKRQMREGDWQSASQTFEELTGRFPKSANLDLFIFNRAKADLYFSEYDKAIAGFGYFTKRFENSPFIAHAHFFRANALYLKGEVTSAVRSYIEAYNRCDDSNLEALVLDALESALSNAGNIEFGVSELTALSLEKKCRVIKILAELHAERGDFKQAETLLGECGLTLETKDHDRFESNQQKDGLEIAVVLPFSGELHSFADDIYNGAVIAAEMYRQETGKKISLSPYDTKGDPIDAARIVADLSKTVSISAVIGPLTSESAAVVSAITSCQNIPIVIPAATQAGLTRLSKSCFQLSPNVELQGVRMAEYAVRELGADSAAVITSTSPDHLRMSRAFANTFEKLGGTIIAIEYYRPRDRDYGKVIRDIKSIMLGSNPDSTFFINERGDTLDVDETRVSFDCLYIPGDATSLRQLIPQIHFYNLSAAYLGSDGWGDAAILKLGNNVTKRAVFPSPFIKTGSTDEYFKFAAAYDTRFGGQPQRLATLGFDAMRMITKSIESSGRSRKQIGEFMQGFTNYNGASGLISFGDERENIEMPLYRIDQGLALGLTVQQSENDVEK